MHIYNIKLLIRVKSLLNLMLKSNSLINVKNFNHQKDILPKTYINPQ